MAVRLACGAAAVPPAAVLATTAVRHGAPLVRRQHSTINTLQRRYSTWIPGSSQHVHAGAMWWRPQPQTHAHIRCMAAQRDQSQYDSSSNNGSDAAAQNGTPAEDGSEQPSASQGSGEPELGRGSLAPDQAGEPPPDVERKSMTYREMLADWFSAGGLLFSYYIGVIFGLHDLGIVTRDTKLAGASAGSLIAACYHSGLPEDLITKACFTLAKDCRDNGTRGRLGSVLVKFLEELLPDDIHEKCRDKAYVAVTRVFPRPTPELISDFESKSDLIAALLTSCHIPWWFDKRVWTSFRGQASYDGGLTNFIPLPPVEHGVRVCCFASKQITSVVDIQISPDNFVEFEHGIQQMVAWAFEPADDKKLEWFIEKGRADAKAWAEATGVLALVGPENQKKQEGVQRAKMTEDADAAEGTAAPAC